MFSGSFSTWYWRSVVMSPLPLSFIQLIAGIVLIRNGDRLGAWLVRDVDDAQAPPASARDFEAIALRIMGIYVLILGFRELAVLAGTWGAEHLRGVEPRAVVVAIIDFVAAAILLRRSANLRGGPANAA